MVLREDVDEKYHPPRTDLYDSYQGYNNSILFPFHDEFVYCPGNVTGWHGIQDKCERLTVFWNGSTNLTGMNFKSLCYLKISGDICDITPFSQVRELHLDNCRRVTDLSPISPANGGKVQKFSTRFSVVTDFNPLKGIKDVALYWCAKQFKQLVIIIVYY
eukprot:gene8911-9648_t